MTPVPTILRMPAPAVRRTALALLVALAAGGGLVACGPDDETAYADGWDDICRDVGEALSTFRTAAASAATVSPDGGDDAVAAGPSSAAVRTDLGRAAASLQRDLTDVVGAARELDPPVRWSAWHTAELPRLDARLRTVDGAVRRLQAGDPDALPLLAIGGVGPASVRAPAALRDRTPECSTLR